MPPPPPRVHQSPGPADYSQALALDEDQLERLQRAAAVMGSLRHENIVQVQRVGGLTMWWCGGGGWGVGGGGGCPGVGGGCWGEGRARGSLNAARTSCRCSSKLIG